MSLLKDYAFFMLAIQLSFTLINLTGIFPVQTDVMGIDVYDNMVHSVEQVRTAFEDASNITDYLAGAAKAMIYGVAIVIQFFLMVFFGASAMLRALQFPPALADTVGLFIGALILYELGSMLLKRG